MAADWLIGSDRAQSARNRLYVVAADLIAERGVDRLDINVLATRAHCSRATIYRHTGGKKQLIEAVFVHTSTRITEVVYQAVDGRNGPDRARVAIAAAIREIRADPVARRFLDSRNAGVTAQSAVNSPAVTTIAADLLGLDPKDTVRGALAVRCFLAILLWPPHNSSDEPQLVQALVTALLATG